MDGIFVDCTFLGLRVFAEVDGWGRLSCLMHSGVRGLEFRELG